MEQIDSSKLMYTLATIVLIQLVSQLMKRAARRTQSKFDIRKSRYFAIKRAITITSLALSLAVVFIIWKVDIKNAWVSMTGMLTLTAIAFFAVWSLVGNILAGFLIYFTSPFKIEDNIEIMPDAICGRVLAINTFYTVLQDSDNNYISIPNSLLFQKYIKLIRTAGQKKQKTDESK